MLEAELGGDSQYARIQMEELLSTQVPYIRIRNYLLAAFNYMTPRAASLFHDNANLSRDDVTQQARLGLLKAIDRFEPSSDTNFETYAWVRMKWEVSHARRNPTGIVNLPRKPKENLTAPQDQPDRRSPLSMCNPKVFICADGFFREVAHPRDGDVLTSIEADDMRSHLRKAIARLSPEEKTVLGARFGLSGEETVTLKDLGTLLGKSELAAWRAQGAVLAKLRSELEKL